MKDTEIGLMLPYSDLPRLMPQKLLAQHFRAPVDAAGLERMQETSNFYSKVRAFSSCILPWVPLRASCCASPCFPFF
jgi:hypothetical protein